MSSFRLLTRPAIRHSKLALTAIRFESVYISQIPLVSIRPVPSNRCLGFAFSTRGYSSIYHHGNPQHFNRFGSKPIPLSRPVLHPRIDFSLPNIGDKYLHTSSNFLNLISEEDGSKDSQQFPKRTHYASQVDKPGTSSHCSMS